jgi:hypothetical protein
VKNKLCFILCQDKAFENKNSFRTNSGDRQTFLDEVARWKTCRNMVDGQKPQALLETLNVTNQDLYPNIYAIFTVLITMPVSSASSERSFSAKV